MNRYTWTHTGRTGARKYQDPARRLVATLTQIPDAGWDWQIDQDGRYVRGGNVPTLAEARTLAETFLRGVTA